MVISSSSFLLVRYCLKCLPQWLFSMTVSTVLLVTSSFTCISYKRSSKLCGGVGT